MNVSVDENDVEALDADPTSLVTRAFALLGAFRTQPVIGVSELARRTGLPRTTVHRLASQLLDVGALSRVGVKYRLGPTLFELGNLHYPPRMRETLQPFLDDLQRVTEGDVGLLELVGRDTIVLQAARARKSTSTLMKLGSRMPASSCVGGQVLVAFNTSRPTRRQTEIRSSGFAVDQGAAESDRTSIAAPVANRRGRVLGALMVSVPTKSLGDNLNRFVNVTTTFARTLTHAGGTADIDFLALAPAKSTATP